MPRIPDYGRVTLPENITVSRDHVRQTVDEHLRSPSREHMQSVWEEFLRTSNRNFYDAVPLHVYYDGAVTFQDPGKDKQKQLLSPFQEWELKNVLTDK